MKKQTYIFIIVIGFFLVLGYFLTRDKEPEYSPIGLDTRIPDNAYCYLYEQEVYDDLGGILGTNREYIEFLLDDSQIQGVHNVLPFDGQGHTSTLLGVTDQGYINAIATVHYEDAIWQEQRIYRFTEDELFVGYQRNTIPRLKNEFGVFMYQDIYEITFETEDFSLARISCEENQQLL